MEVVSGPLRLSEGTGSQARLACGRAARPGAGARLGLPGTTGRRGLSLEVWPERLMGSILRPGWSVLCPKIVSSEAT